MKYFWWALPIVGVAVAIWCLFHFTEPKLVTENTSQVANQIFFEQKWYALLYTRYTALDWVLGLMAAGTAVAAAVKNAFSTKRAANPPANPNPPVEGATVDSWVMTLAALAIIATTLDAKIHPAQQAERYRQGDLLLQDAVMDYRHSVKADKDDQALLDVWHQAQRILEGSPAAPPSVKKPDPADHPLAPPAGTQPNPSTTQPRAAVPPPTSTTTTTQVPQPAPRR